MATKKDSTEYTYSLNNNNEIVSKIVPIKEKESDKLYYKIHLSDQNKQLKIVGDKIISDNNIYIIVYIVMLIIFSCLLLCPFIYKKIFKEK